MATTPNFLNPAIFADVSTPPTPESGYMKLYSKTGVLTVLNSGGVENSLNLSAYLPLAGGTLTQPVSTSGSPTAFTLTGAAHTTLALSTEATDVNFNLARTVQFATGALATQRAMRIQAPTYGFVAASTITTASTLSISGPPVAGTNATITSAYALNVESGNANFAGSLNVVGTAYATTYSFMNQNLQISAAAAPYTMLFYMAGLACQMSLIGTTLCVGSGGSIGFASGGLGATTTTGDTLLFRDAAGTLAQRNSTNAQTFRVYNTYTSATSYETLNLKGKAAANFEIGPENGSAGGTLRGLTIGGYALGSATITGWLQFRPNATTAALEAFYLGPIADSTAVGGNARGTGSVDLQMSRAAATQVVSSPNSFAAGASCTVTGGSNGGVAIGYNCSVTDSIGGSVCMGINSTANGYRAIAIGYNSNATTDNIALGTASQAAHGGAICLMGAVSYWAGTIIWTKGDATGTSYNNAFNSIGGYAIAYSSIRTVNATPTLLSILAYTTAMGTRYRHRGVSLEVSFSLVAVRSDGLISRWSRSYLAKDVATYLGVSTLTLVSTDTVGTDLTEIPGISFAVTVDTATKSLRVTVTGEAAFTVTGDAATDVLTSVGHTLVNSDVVVFNAITGGTGLSTNVGGQYYYAIYRVINVVGDTFQLTSADGSSTTAINFTTDITAGTLSRPILWTASNVRFGSCSGGY